MWSQEDPSRGGSLAAFLVVASAMIGSVTAGLAADRIGRTTVCLCSLFVSIVVSLVIGWIPAEMPGLSLFVGILWGIFAVAESAQYSAMTSEVVDKDVVGNAVTIQFGIGYVNMCVCVFFYLYVVVVVVVVVDCFVVCFVVCFVCHQF